MGSVRDMYDYVYVSSCYREFERKTLIRVFMCVEFSFSKLASEMFFVTMEYVHCKPKTPLHFPYTRKRTECMGGLREISTV